MNNIIDNKNGGSYSIFSNHGKYLLKNYIRYYRNNVNVNSNITSSNTLPIIQRGGLITGRYKINFRMSFPLLEANWNSLVEIHPELQEDIDGENPKEWGKYLHGLGYKLSPKVLIDYFKYGLLHSINHRIYIKDDISQLIEQDTPLIKIKQFYRYLELYFQISSHNKKTIEELEEYNYKNLCQYKILLEMGSIFLRWKIIEERYNTRGWHPKLYGSNITITDVKLRLKFNMIHTFITKLLEHVCYFIVLCIVHMGISNILELDPEHQIYSEKIANKYIITSEKDLIDISFTHSFYIYTGDGPLRESGEFIRFIIENKDYFMVQRELEYIQAEKFMNDILLFKPLHKFIDSGIFGSTKERIQGMHELIGQQSQGLNTSPTNTTNEGGGAKK